MPKPITPQPNNAECERMVGAIDTGVLVMCRDTQPYAVPMNHAYLDGKLYFHCATTGRKLDVIRANPNVCYVVSNDLGLGERAAGFSCHVAWESVIAYGTARVIEDEQGLREAFLIFGRHYRGDEFELRDTAFQDTRAIILDITAMTARQEIPEDKVSYWSWSPR